MDALPREDLVPPLCLRVDNTIAALQQIARYWRRKLDLRVVGITGSVGKSTTKELVAEVLSTRYRTLKSPGNLNNEIGLPLTMLRLSSGYQRGL
jgi:UDP-N-acetylmuramoyl-tripeptide--D-alanyl-D-alanine ligase